MSRRRRRSRMGRKRRIDLTHPAVLLLAGFLAVAGLAALAVFVVFPGLKETLGLVKPKATPPPRVVRPTPTPSPTPMPLQDVDFEAQAKRFALDETFIAYPVVQNGRLIFAASEDGVKNDKFVQYNIERGEYVQFETPTLANDGFANLVANEKWLCYLDHKEGGGGVIMAQRSGSAPFAVKTYYAGMPRLWLAGDMLVWMERTGTYMDKIFAYDLISSENVTLHTFREQRLGDYGTGRVCANGDTIVWAYYDPDQSVPEFNAAPKSSIHVLRLGSVRAEIYKGAGTYVHNPIVSGDALAWADKNHAPGQKLYLRVGTGDPAVVADGVTDYAFGEGFLLYCKGERLYARLLDGDVTLPVTPDGTRAIFVGVSGGYILWYDVTDSAAQGTKDILKYVKLP